MSKAKDLREQDDQQLNTLLAETQNQLFRLRFQSETDKSETPSEIVKSRREIARIKTILHERTLGKKPLPGVTS